MRCIALIFTLLVLFGCEQASNGRKDDLARLNKIARIYKQGDAAEAVEQLKDYLNAYPRNGLAWTILGHAYKDIHRLDEAEAAYESALAVNPRQFEAITGQGILHSIRGDYHASMQCYKRALEIDPTYAHAYSSMAMIALKQNDDKRALEYAKKGYDLDKSDPDIAANLAIAYHYNNDAAKRDELTAIAILLGFTNLDALDQIYTGELTVGDRVTC